MLAAVGKFFTSKAPDIPIRRSEAPLLSTKYANELADYILANYVVNNLSRKSLKQSRSKGGGEAGGRHGPDDDMDPMFTGTFVLQQSHFKKPGVKALSHSLHELRSVSTCVPDLDHASEELGGI